MGRMKSEFDRLRAMSLHRFFGYMVLAGGFSGLGAWLLVLAGALVFGMPKPTWPAGG